MSRCIGLLFLLMCAVSGAQAQGSRAPIARLADVVSGYFVPIVVGLATLSFFIWWGIEPTAAGFSTAVERFVAVLVIAFVCDAMRKIVSVVIRRPLSLSDHPNAFSYTT